MGMKINGFELQTSFKTLPHPVWLRWTSVWLLTCPTPQQHRDTEGQPQLTVLQPLLLPAARKQSPAPPSCPSQHILKSK